MSSSCAVCGGAASLSLRDTYGETPLCNTCLDRTYPNLALGSLAQKFTNERTPADSCPYCGWTRDQLTQTGLLGCPLCYEVLLCEIA